MILAAMSTLAIVALASSESSTPAPLYRDPIWDGAADPVLVWNPKRKAWWMYYTQRRAKAEEPGVAWCHGTEIGIAESKDRGMTWSYVGIAKLKPTDAGYSFWAPDIIRAKDGTYHLFVSYVPGAASTHAGWGGHRYIYQYTSKDLDAWKFEQRVPMPSDYCIDPSLIQLPNGTWRMWFKDEGHGSKTYAVDSNDLRKWVAADDPGVSKLYGEGPKVFDFGGYKWLIKDPDSGLDVYRSRDLSAWTYQGKILEKPGKRNSDGSIGKHADVVVSGNRAFIIYFTHPYGQNYPEVNGFMSMPAKTSAIQAAELFVVDGKLVCDRDRPFKIDLKPPKP